MLREMRGRQEETRRAKAEMGGMTVLREMRGRQEETRKANDEMGGLC